MFYWSDNRIYKGEWKENKMLGYGELSISSIKNYFGLNICNSYLGYGIYYNSTNNRIFVGSWIDNKREGFCKFLEKDKPSKFGFYEKGVLIKAYKSKFEVLKDKKFDSPKLLDLEYDFIHAFIMKQ